jgi:type I restriction enzyme M protein
LLERFASEEGKAPDTWHTSQQMTVLLAALVGSYGVLFRGAIEGRIRQRLITENLLDAVIALPAGLFPNSTAPLVILLFDRSREAGGARSHVSDVFLLDVGCFVGGNRHQLTEEQLSQIVHLVETRQAQGRYFIWPGGRRLSPMITT